MPTKPQDPWADTPALNQRIVSAIARIGAVLRSNAWAFATAEGLNPAQLDVLELLAQRSEGVRLTWIAAQLGVTPASASDSVASLIGKGLVEKARSADDARAVALSLTSAGRKLAKKIGGAAEFAREAVHHLPPSAQEALFSHLLTLIGQLQRSESFPQTRACVSCQHFEPHAHANPAAPHHCHLVNAALPQRLLRLDCPDHQAAQPAAAAKNWRLVQLQ